MENKTLYLITFIVSSMIFITLVVLDYWSKKKRSYTDQIENKNREIEELKSVIDVNIEQINLIDNRLSDCKIERNENELIAIRLNTKNAELIIKNSKLTSKIVHLENVIKSNNEQFGQLENQLKEV